jgi:hypothetical protein
VDLVDIADTRGRTATRSEASKRPVYSSHCTTLRASGVATDTVTERFWATAEELHAISAIAVRPAALQFIDICINPPREVRVGQ